MKELINLKGLLQKYSFVFYALIGNIKLTRVKNDKIYFLTEDGNEIYASIKNNIITFMGAQKDEEYYLTFELPKDVASTKLQVVETFKSAYDHGYTVNHINRIFILRNPNMELTSYFSSGHLISDASMENDPQLPTKKTIEERLKMPFEHFELLNYPTQEKLINSISSSKRMTAGWITETIETDSQTVLAKVKEGEEIILGSGDDSITLESKNFENSPSKANPVLSRLLRKIKSKK